MCGLVAARAGYDAPEAGELIKKEWLIATSDLRLNATVGRACSNEKGSWRNPYREEAQGKNT